MNNSILLSAQRKILGGYMNAEECALNGERDIMKEVLTEDMFDLPFHKVVVRAINNLKEHNTTVTSLTVQNFIDAYGYPKNIDQEYEFLTLMEEAWITKTSFYTYIDLIKEKRNKAREGDI